MSDISNQQMSSNAHKIDYDYNVFTVLVEIFKYGDIFTRLSFLIMGLANLVRGQIVKGLIFLSTEIAFFIFMAKYGFKNLHDMITLGDQAVEQTIDAEGFVITKAKDQSLKMLLFGVCTLLIICAFVLMWKGNVKSGYLAQYAVQRGRRPKSFVRDILDLFDCNLHKTMLFFPMAGILAFTVSPLIFMILIAFTNFDNKEHNGMMQLFDWIGFKNFGDVLGMSAVWGDSFWRILGWTIVWAIFSTFTCYIGGMLLALLINRKGIKFKGLWRTIFVISTAVPQFVTLLLISKLLGDTGAINNVLQDIGILAQGEYIKFLSDITMARVVVIVVNFWVGVPYTMLVMTGILMNIPADLYESAKIDGANNVVMFFKITLPYMIFVTTPHLISSFIGNINNFNLIYLLTGGGPNYGELYQAGSTDLLITWLYKLTNDQGLYGYASTIGILVFIICATFSLITYRNSGSYKNEEEFQ